jgi:hypothetical protein
VAGIPTLWHANTGGGLAEWQEQGAHVGGRQAAALQQPGTEQGGAEQRSKEGGRLEAPRRVGRVEAGPSEGRVEAGQPSREGGGRYAAAARQAGTGAGKAPSH